MSDVVESNERRRRRPYSEHCQIGEPFSRLVNTGTLGMGKFGSVLPGYLTNNKDIKVAIKSSIGSEDKEIRRLFYNEYLALQKCSGCPNVVKVYGYLATVNEQHTVNLYFAMEKADGSLADYLKKRYRNGLPPEMLMTLICHSAAALQKLHEQKLYHLDLKPANILLFEDGTGPFSRFRFAFCDLGLIREKKQDGTIGRTSPTMNTVKGTPTEMHPAVLRAYIEGHAAKVEAKTLYIELWPMACVLHEAATGRKIVHGLPRLRSEEQKKEYLNKWLASIDLIENDIDAIAYDAAGERLIRDVENSTYPKWLRHCIRTLICIMLKPENRELETTKRFEHFAEKLRNGRLLKICFPQIGMMTSHMQIEDEAISPQLPNFNDEINARLPGEGDLLIAYQLQVHSAAASPNLIKTKPSFERLMDNINIYQLVCGQNPLVMVFRKDFVCSKHHELFCQEDEDIRGIEARAYDISSKNEELKTCCAEIISQIKIEDLIVKRGKEINKVMDPELNLALSNLTAKHAHSQERVFANLITSIDNIKENKLPSVVEKAKSLSNQYTVSNIETMLRMQEMKNNDAINRTQAPTTRSNINNPIAQTEMVSYKKEMSDLLNEDIRRYNSNWSRYSVAWTRLQPIMELFVEFRILMEDLLQEACLCLNMAKND